MQQLKANYSISVFSISEVLLCGSFLPLLIRCPVKVLIGPEMCYRFPGTCCGTEVTTFCCVCLHVHIASSVFNTNDTSLQQMSTTTTLL